MTKKQQYDKPAEPPKKEKRPVLLHFIADAYLDFTLVDKAALTEFEIELTETWVFLSSRKTKAQYGVPTTNIRTVVFA